VSILQTPDDAREVEMDRIEGPNGKPDWKETLFIALGLLFVGFLLVLAVPTLFLIARELFMR
jgi:hypothetical protein